MSSAQRIAGILYAQVDGVMYKARGKFTYNLGTEKREGVVGLDSVHGYKVMPQLPFIEGEFTDSADLNVRTLQLVDGSTVTLQLANGKVIALRAAWYAGEGTIDAEEATIPARFEGLSAEEIA